MASVRTAIELQDNFTSILYQVISSVNLGLSAMEDLRQGMNASVDTASMEAARDSVNQATIAVQQLDAAIQEMEAPEVQIPTIPQSSAPVVLPVQTDVPEPFVEQPPPVDVPIQPEQPEPVEIPVHWQSDRLEVFTNSGVERFQQEVQSANTMLEQLSNTQDVIARQAYNTTIFPPGAFQDLNNMAVRIDMIRNRIQQIESNPLNMGTDTANVGLEQLRGQLSQAIQTQRELNRAVENLDVQSANEAYLRLQQVIGGTERYIRDNVDAQGQFNQEIQQGKEESNKLMQMLKGVAVTYGSLQTVKNVLNISDQMTSTTARLDMMNDGLQSTKELQDMIFLSAERSRGSYQATANAVSKLGLMAGDAFGSSEEIIGFMEQVNKQFIIAGTEASGIDAAMLQLTQAMGSGVLRGEEYNSILEQAPNIIQTIADYLGVSKGKLREMAGEGEITADIVKAAMFAAADETNEKFENMPKTFEQIWTSFENHALMAFQPVLQRCNDIANSERFQEFVNGMIGALSAAAGITMQLFDLLGAGADILINNWSWLSPIIYGVAGALMVYYGAMLLYNTVTGISAAVTAAKTVAEKIHAASLAMGAGATFTATAAQYGFNAALLACPITWIIILIIALIAIIYAVVAAFNKLAGASVSATGIICGVIAVAGAFILNTAIGLINAILQGVWSFASPFIGIVEWILNVANGGFDSFGGAVANLIGQIISWFLSLGMVVTKIIDAIFGTDWTSGLSELQSSVLGWGKNEDAITLNRSAPTINYRMDYKDVWDAGNSFGEGIDEKIANFDLTSLFGPSNIPSEEDYINGPLGEGINSIATNTGKMANSMDITSEELKYLRDIAEQETINRFTTAEIHIDQSGMRNHIKNGTDLDGVVSGLTDAMIEAVDMVAEGVHE